MRHTPGPDPQEDCKRRIAELEQALQAAERLNAELSQALESMENAAGTDRLTGAWNRRRFEEAAGAEMSLARRRRGPVSLLVLDLDHFKQVNDLFGHDAGDRVLVEFCQAVRGAIRSSDTLVRWGGEEFLVLAPATHLDGALSLGEKVRAAVANCIFTVPQPITVSVGVAEFFLGMDLASWIRCADEALYRAKSEGRNRVASGSGAEASAPPPSILEILWDEAYGCGVATIDTQHRHLFALGNALFGAVTSGQSPSEVSMHLHRLSAHISQHFHDEEALLRKAGFEGLERHAKIHRNLGARLTRLQAELDQGRLELSMLVEFLIMEVIQGHMLVEDRQFFPCLQGS